MEITKKINYKIFREYDIRGIYKEDLNEDVAYTIGKAFGSYALKHGENKVVIGHDNRKSYSVLYPALEKGLLDSGINVLSLGLITTPMHHFAQLHYDVNAGIMITASHNPKEYNGFKMSLKKDDSLYGKPLQEFKDYVQRFNFLSGEGVLIEDDVFPAYLENLKKSLNFGDRKVKAVVDCGNGTGSIFIENILKQFNIEYELLYCESDSDFPNHVPDPAVKDNLKDLGKKVKELGYDVGLAVDGDADRCGMVLEDGSYISADLIMLLFYRSLAKQMKGKEGVYDVKCSLSLSDEIEKLGLKPQMNRTGSVYCRSYVCQNKLSFGGEYSGHLFFNDRYLGYDDGIYGILRIAELLSKTDKKVSELFSDISKYYSTDEIKVGVTDSNKFQIVDSVIKYTNEKGYKYSLVDGIRVMFPDGFALVRASNTGPDLTIRFEAKTKARLEEIQKEYTMLIGMLK